MLAISTNRIVLTRMNRRQRVDILPHDVDLDHSPGLAVAALLLDSHHYDDNRRSIDQRRASPDDYAVSFIRRADTIPPHIFV
jgi:hypothetical protein